MPAQSNELLAAMEDNSQTAILYADAQGVLRYWNCGAERLFGHSAAQAVGRPVDLIIPDAHHEMHWKGFHRRIGTDWVGPPGWGEIPGRHRDGSDIGLQVLLVPMHDGNGAIRGIMAMFRKAVAAA